MSNTGIRRSRSSNSSNTQRPNQPANTANNINSKQQQQQHAPQEQPRDADDGINTEELVAALEQFSGKQRSLPRKFGETTLRQLLDLSQHPRMDTLRQLALQLRKNAVALDTLQLAWRKERESSSTDHLLCSDDEERAFKLYLHRFVATARATPVSDPDEMKRQPFALFALVADLTSRAVFPLGPNSNSNDDDDHELTEECKALRAVLALSSLDGPGVPLREKIRVLGVTNKFPYQEVRSFHFKTLDRFVVSDIAIDNINARVLITSSYTARRHVSPPVCLLTGVLSCPAMRNIEHATNSHDRIAIISGESGVGKTLAALLFASRAPNVCGIYLTADDVFPWPGSIEEAKAVGDTMNNPSVSSDNEEEDPVNNADKDARVDKMCFEAIMKKLHQLLGPVRVPPEQTAFSSAAPLGAPARFPVVETAAEFVIIIDEMGAFPIALHGLCRVAKTLLPHLRRVLSINTVRIVAVGTGCADGRIQLPASHRDSFVTALLPPDKALWTAISDRYLGSVQQQQCFDTRLERLGGNARFAAMLGNWLVKLIDSVPEACKKDPTWLLQQLSAFVPTALVTFVGCCGLSKFCDPVSVAMQALSHVVHGATHISSSAWRTCATTAGLLTDTASKTNNNTFNEQQHLKLASSSHLVGSKTKPRFAMSETAVAMLLQGFGGQGNNNGCRAIGQHCFEDDVFDTVLLFARLPPLPDVETRNSCNVAAQTPLFKIMKQLLSSEAACRVTGVQLVGGCVPSDDGSISEELLQCIADRDNDLVDDNEGTGGSLRNDKIVVIRNGEPESHFADIIVMSCKRLVLIRVNNSSSDDVLSEMGWEAGVWGGVEEQQQLQHTATLHAAPGRIALKKLVKLCRGSQQQQEQQDANTPFPVDLVILQTNSNENNNSNVARSRLIKAGTIKLTAHIIDVSTTQRCFQWRRIALPVRSTSRPFSRRSMIIRTWCSSRSERMESQ